MNYLAQDVERISQLDPDRPLMEDRAVELGEFLKLPTDQVRALYRAYNIDKSIPIPTFDPSSFQTIIDGYTNPHAFKRDISRLMLHYTRFAGAAELLTEVSTHFSSTHPLSVVDYGCGAADYGLAFAKAGHNVTLVDFEEKVAFASWRFTRRKLPVRQISVHANNEYPELHNVDLVIAGDLLEHVRDPVRVVQGVHSALRPNGLFWFPDFPFKEKSVGGHHLHEAAGLRAAAADVVNALFDRVSKLKHLVRKK